MYVCMCALVLYMCVYLKVKACTYPQKYTDPYTNTPPKTTHKQASSRSHSLLLVSVTTTDRATGKVAKGRLILVCVICLFL